MSIMMKLVLICDVLILLGLTAIIGINYHFLQKLDELVRMRKRAEAEGAGMIAHAKAMAKQVGMPYPEIGGNIVDPGTPKLTFERRTSENWNPHFVDKCFGWADDIMERRLGPMSEHQCYAPAVYIAQLKNAEGESYWPFCEEHARKFADFQKLPMPGALQ